MNSKYIDYAVYLNRVEVVSCMYICEKYTRIKLVHTPILRLYTPLRNTLYVHINDWLPTKLQIPLKDTSVKQANEYIRNGKKGGILHRYSITVASTAKPVIDYLDVTPDNINTNKDSKLIVLHYYNVHCPQWCNWTSINGDIASKLYRFKDV